jgi:putative ABC transport system permease protein
MLGMAMYSTQTRTKEIGVRKVMGATSKQIALLLSKSFLKLLGVAAFLAAPVSYLLADAFLNNYAYRIEITIDWLVMGIGLVMILGLVTIASQTMKASVVNPVKSLRYE